MRVQIRKGLTFKQAAALWRKRKRVAAKKSKKRTAYNIFISMQLKQGKTMKQAIRAWNRLKKPPKKRRKKKVVAKKPKKRRVKRKAKPKPKTITRIRKVTVEKPVVVTKEVFPEARISAIVNQVVKKAQSREEKRVDLLKRFVSKKSVSRIVPGEELGNEEIALRVLDIYFTEVARYGLKRSLSLDEVINAYFYSLLRVARKGIELAEVSEIIKKGKI